MRFTKIIAWGFMPKSDARTTFYLEYGNTPSGNIIIAGNPIVGRPKFLVGGALPSFTDQFPTAQSIQNTNDATSHFA